jgi:hypothetical protein
MPILFPASLQHKPTDQPGRAGALRLGQDAYGLRHSRSDTVVK